MKLEQDVIDKIKTYNKETSDSDIAKELGICRHTVAKYR